MAMQSNPEKVSIGDRRIGRLRRLIRLKQTQTETAGRYRRVPIYGPPPLLIDYGILQTDSIPIRITSTVLISPTIGFPVLY
jgi:hypothetical protein